MEGGFNPSVRRVGTLHWNRGFMIGAGAFLYACHPLTGLVCCRFFFTGCWLLSGCFCSFLNLCSAPVLAVGRTFNPERPSSVGILRSWAWQFLLEVCVRCLRTLPQIFVNSTDATQIYVIIYLSAVPESRANRTQRLLRLAGGNYQVWFS